MLIGFSDITALLLAIHKETGLIGFHGPVGSSDFTNYTKEYITKVLIEPTNNLTIRLSEENQELGKNGESLSNAYY